jgi:adenosylmethionine-8-amino-7-oxononanoate aminotransferase
MKVKNLPPIIDVSPSWEDAADIEDTIRFSTPGHVAAFIAEPLQGVGGVVGADAAYF